MKHEYEVKTMNFAGFEDPQNARHNRETCFHKFVPKGEIQAVVSIEPFVMHAMMC